MKNKQINVKKEGMHATNNQVKDNCFKQNYKDVSKNQKNQLKKIQEIKYKDSLIESPSLTPDYKIQQLQIIKKSYQQTIQQIKQQYEYIIEAYKVNQMKFEEKIRELQKRNSFLEHQIKRRTDNNSNNKKQSKYVRRSSVRSILKDFHNQENKIDTSRFAKSSRELTPKKQKFNQNQNKFTLQNRYLKRIIQQLMKSDQLKSKVEEDLITNDLQYVNKTKLKINSEKIQFSEVLDQQRTKFKKLQNMIAQLLEIIKQHQVVIQNLKQKNNQFVVYVNQFMDIFVKSNPETFFQSYFTNLEKLTNVIMKTIKQKYNKKINENQQIKNIKINNYLCQINKISKMYVEVKTICGLNTNHSHQDLIIKIEKMKARDKKLSQENEELMNIVEGLIKCTKN